MISDGPVRQPASPVTPRIGVESHGDAEIFGEAIAYVAGEAGRRAIANECRLPIDVLRRQLAGRRALTLRTVMGALRGVGLQLHVDLAVPPRG